MKIKEYKITEMLYEKCINVSVKNNTWNCRCPLCGDSETKKNVARFVVSYYPMYDTYMYKCYRCGESNNIYMLYTQLYDASYKEAKIFLDDTTFNAKSIKKVIKNKKDNKKKEKTTNIDINIKKDCYSVNSIGNSILSKKLIKKLNIFIKERQIKNCYIAHQGKYKGRIILPVINNNKLEYFQARTLYNDILPKYLNPYIEKTPIIFNKDVIKDNKDIIIVEGLIDAMSVGNQCTSTLGADISDKKLDILMKMTKRNIIICADNDIAGIKGIKRTLKKSKYAKILKYFIMPKKYSMIKDMNNLLLSGLVKNIEDFILKNSYSYFYIKTFFKL